MGFGGFIIGIVLLSVLVFILFIFIFNRKLNDWINRKVRKMIPNWNKHFDSENNLKL